MNRVVDVERVRLECQSDPLADRELSLDADVHIRVVRRKQSQRSRPRNAADRVGLRVDEGRLVEIGRGGDISGSRRAILPHAPRKARVVVRIAGGVDNAAAVACAGNRQRRPALVRENSGNLPAADQKVQRLDVALQFACAEGQLIYNCGAQHGRVIDDARSFLEVAVVRLAHPSQIVQLLAVGVIEHVRHAVR